MLTRLKFYTVLALRDLWRLNTASRLQVVIVTGICLPVLLLLAFKQGLVADLREELMTSPSGRRIKIYVNQGEFFRLDELDLIRERLGPVDTIVPDLKRTCLISRVDEHDSPPEMRQPLDVLPTVEGDPVLVKLNADVLGRDSLGIVLLSNVAQALDVDVGDIVQLTLTRNDDEVTLIIPLRAVIPTDRSDRLSYVHVDVLARMKRFMLGGGVPEWNWPASNREPKCEFQRVLLLAEAGDEVSGEDRKALKRRDIKISPVPLDEIPGLSSLLSHDGRESLVAYLGERVDQRPIPEFFLKEITDTTRCDEVAMPWPEERRLVSDGEDILAWSLTFPPKCRWLRNYFSFPDVGYERLDAPLQCQTLGQLTAVPRQISVRLDSGQHAILSTTCLAPDLPQPDESSDLRPQASQPHLDPDGPPPPPMPIKSDSQSISPTSIVESGSESLDIPAQPQAPAHVVVPAKLFQFLDQTATGTAVYDPALGSFVPTPPPPTCEEILVYAKTIDDVLDVVANARRLDYAFHAENARIEEIRDQEGALGLLVYVVGIAVFAFGVMTVVTVLLDSTEQKRNMIGVLRVMGASRVGVFYFVVFRATVIGVVAGFVTILMGHLIARLLSPIASATVSLVDSQWVFLGSIACCMFGALLPAWRASQTDPIQAVIEGRHR